MVEMSHTASALDCTPQPNTGANWRRPGRPPAKSAHGGRAIEREAILTRTVELDVIPRLLRAHGLGKVVPIKAPGVSVADVGVLVDLTLATDDMATTAYAVGLQDQGFQTESLYLDLLAPAAERLGTMWEQDLCDFSEVTIGLSRLHRAMRDLSSSLIGSRGLQFGRRAAKRALLIPLPGEQHTFGISMVIEFFHRAGWNAWSEPLANSGELATLVRSSWVDVVGFSLACDERLETARTEIQSVRLASRNPGVAVMVGGPAFVADPSLAAAIGADGTARDGMQAVRQATVLVERETARRIGPRAERR